MVVVISTLFHVKFRRVCMLNYWSASFGNAWMIGASCDFMDS